MIRQRRKELRSGRESSVRRSRIAFGSIGWSLIPAAILYAIACSSDDNPKVALAQGCLVNSDCFSPLSCTFGRCHTACKETRDCPRGERCLFLSTGNVCQLADETECTFSSECPAMLKCAVDSRCRVACMSAGDCLATQQCNTHVCTDPTDIPQGSTGLPPTNPQGGWNGVNDNGGQSVDAGTDVSVGRDADGNAGGGGGAGQAGASGQGGSTPQGGSGGQGGTPGKGGSTGQGGAAGQGGAVGKDSGPGGPTVCADGGTELGFHPSNLQDSLVLPAGLTDVLLQGCTFDTDTMTGDNAPCKDVPNAVVDLGTGRQAAVIFAHNFTIDVGKSVTFTGEKPAILVATGKVEINGSILANASKTTGWRVGGAPGPATSPHDGICPMAGSGGGGTQGNWAKREGSGGGSFCGLGGSGGTVVDGSVGPAGGGPYGTPDLVPLVGGSSGGITESSDVADNFGGGAIEIVAATSILVGSQGAIHMGGGSWNSGSGGGSGGAILLEAPSVTVRGVLAANGGGGGANSSGSAAGANDRAAPGAADLTARGGIGSAGGLADGAIGLSGTNYAAGGGGGAGRIRINTGCGGTLTITPSEAVISPYQSTGCFTTGTLR